MTSPPHNPPPHAPSRETAGRRVLRWLRHAFATSSPADEAPPSPGELAVVERLCGLIVQRRMAAPALLFLESIKPLNYVTAQALHFFAPFAATLGDAQAYEDLARFLERRDAVERMYARIEELDRARE